MTPPQIQPQPCKSEDKDGKDKTKIDSSDKSRKNGRKKQHKEQAGGIIIKKSTSDYGFDLYSFHFEFFH